MHCFALCGFLYILNLHLLDDLVLFSVIVQQSIKNHRPVCFDAENDNHCRLQLHTENPLALERELNFL